ncbi:hypothetical protein UA08_07868 [Talaromyces atroroseus]|uniref:Amidohydrolase-related domain-containing protein n=1 Tax=Talaromyces atroroseus TaxID=1441469 RepID=A0A225AFA5_TALAT|nr:hypothetical protein UA08_07868 [Talaromyces atroroseus]OKL56734.1 hypothetical protein UA08_07868 [Talaromyces atroroseus]
MQTTQSLFPNGGWDVHHHIFDLSYNYTPYTAARFPYSPDRHLTPPAATIKQYIEFRESIGLSHSVLTHGLSYGDDCSSLSTFVPELDFKITKAIGVIDPYTLTSEEARGMRDAGICGIRVNLYRYQAMHDVERQKTALCDHARALQQHCPRWSMAFTHIHPEFWTELKPFIEQEITPTGIRLVTDHFALLKGSSMLSNEGEAADSLVDVIQQPGFQAITDLMRASHLFVKISAPYRVSNQAPGYQDLEPLGRALFDANPKQLLWGSDWPHTPRMKVRSHKEAMAETPFLNVDNLAWLKSLRSWLSDEEWNSLMISNPKAFYAS